METCCQDYLKDPGTITNCQTPNQEMFWGSRCPGNHSFISWKCFVSYLWCIYLLINKINYNPFRRYDESQHLIKWFVTLFNSFYRNCFTISLIHMHATWLLIQISTFFGNYLNFKRFVSTWYHAFQR